MASNPLWSRPTDSNNLAQAEYMRICKQHLSGFPITYIGFSVLFARSFLKVPNINFNIFQKVLVGPLGHQFIKDARASGRTLLVWTVNEEEWMEWSIRKEVDGVITDFPEKYLELRKRHESASSGETSDTADSTKPAPQLSLSSKRRGLRHWANFYWSLVAFQFMATVFTGLLIFRTGWPSTQVKRSQLIAKS
jgi:phosphatidylglycerol phospholipase C